MDTFGETLMMLIITEVLNLFCPESGFLKLWPKTDQLINRFGEMNQTIEWLNMQLQNSKDPLEKASMILNQANSAIVSKTLELQSLEKEAFSYLPTVTESLIPELISKTRLLKENSAKCIINQGENPELNQLLMLDLVLSRMEMTRNALKEA